MTAGTAKMASAIRRRIEFFAKPRTAMTTAMKVKSCRKQQPRKKEVKLVIMITATMVAKRKARKRNTKVKKKKRHHTRAGNVGCCIPSIVILGILVAVVIKRIVLGFIKLIIRHWIITKTPFLLPGRFSFLDAHARVFSSP